MKNQVLAFHIMRSSNVGSKRFISLVSYPPIVPVAQQALLKPEFWQICWIYRLLGSVDLSRLNFVREKSVLIATSSK